MGKTGRVMLVDDEPPLLKMMGAFLRRMGYEVTAFAQTDEAWRQVEPDLSSYALAVLDMTMGGMSAEELASRLLAGSPTICVIASSGYPADLSRLESAAPGRITFLHKPFTPEMLAGAVKGMLG